MKARLLRLEGRELVDFLRLILVKLSREPSRVETGCREGIEKEWKAKGEKERNRK